MFRILLTNDDGIQAPGLRALARACGALGPVAVLAPEVNRSGASQSLTLDRPVGVRRLGAGAWCVGGTPADCVHLAFTGALQDALEQQLGGPPNLVLSGINDGENLGDDVQFSGTVGAAQVAALFQCPALAVSAPAAASGDVLVRGAQAVVDLLASGLLEHGPLWNLNLPADWPAAATPQVRFTRLGQRLPARPALAAQAPRGAAGWWIGAFATEWRGAPHVDAIPCDHQAVAQGAISATPLALCRSDLQVLRAAQAWMPRLPVAAEPADALA